MQYIIGGVYKIRSYYVQNTMYISKSDCLLYKGVGGRPIIWKSNLFMGGSLKNLFGSTAIFFAYLVAAY